MNAKHKKLAGVLATIAVMAFAAGPSQAEPFKVIGSKARGVAAQQFGPWVVDLTPSAISALGSLLGPQPAPAAGPLSVTQSGTWSMNGTVQVGNPADNPALVRDVRERQAVHVEEKATFTLCAERNTSIPGVCENPAKIGVVVVPAGVRLAIEHVSANVTRAEVPGVADLATVNPATLINVLCGLANLGGPTQAPCRLSVPVIPGGISVAVNTILLHPAQPDDSVDHFMARIAEIPKDFTQTIQTRLYADPGTQVEVVVENFTGLQVGIDAVFSASGYIEACPPGALPITCP